MKSVRGSDKVVCANVDMYSGLVYRMLGIPDELEHCETCEIHEDKIKQVSEHMPDEDELYDLAELFKIFGDSTRIRILYVLFESEVCVCDLAESGKR